AREWRRRTRPRPSCANSRRHLQRESRRACGRPPSLNPSRATVSPCYRRHSAESRPSSDRRGVLQAALVPQGVQAAADLDRRAHADIALEDLSIVADRLDDAIGPIIGEAKPLAEPAL